MNDAAKGLIFFGSILVALGLFAAVSGKLLQIGRLPGDIVIRKGNFSFYFPVMTSLIVSVVLTLVLSLSGRK
jgi:hypothetical protein